MENKNFKSVKLYKTLDLEYLKSCIKTAHINENRKERLKLAKKYNNDSPIDRTFLVDKGHPDGPELHSISENAVIYIINANTRRFITILFARPNQVIRLYKKCGLTPPEKIVSMANFYVKNGINHS